MVRISGAGESFAAVEEAYLLSREQVLAAIRYAGHVAAHLPAGAAGKPGGPWFEPAHQDRGLSPRSVCQIHAGISRRRASREQHTGSTTA